MQKPSKNPVPFADFEKVTITISLVNDSVIEELNATYLDRHYPTDVLSFNIDEAVDEKTYHLGDVVVSVERAAGQAEDYGNDLEHEIAELAEHGILHLLGVHHKGDDHK